MPCHTWCLYLHWIPPWYNRTGWPDIKHQLTYLHWIPCHVLFGTLSWYRARCLAGCTFTGCHAMCCLALCLDAMHCLAGCTFNEYHAFYCLAGCTFTGCHAMCCLAGCTFKGYHAIYLAGCTFSESPWYNCTCWLGIKHQFTYLLTFSEYHALCLAGFALCGYHVTVAGFNVSAYHAICSLAAFTFSGYHV